MKDRGEKNERGPRDREGQQEDTIDNQMADNVVCHRHYYMCQ